MEPRGGKQNDIIARAHEILSEKDKTKNKHQVSLKSLVIPPGLSHLSKDINFIATSLGYYDKVITESVGQQQLALRDCSVANLEVGVNPSIPSRFNNSFKKENFHTLNSSISSEDYAEAEDLQNIATYESKQKKLVSVHQEGKKKTNLCHSTRILSDLNIRYNISNNGVKALQCQLQNSVSESKHIEQGNGLECFIFSWKLAHRAVSAWKKFSEDSKKLHLILRQWNEYSHRVVKARRILENCSEFTWRVLARRGIEFLRIYAANKRQKNIKYAAINGFIWCSLAKRGISSLRSYAIRNRQKKLITRTINEFTLRSLKKRGVGSLRSYGKRNHRQRIKSKAISEFTWTSLAKKGISSLRSHAVKKCQQKLKSSTLNELTWNTLVNRGIVSLRSHAVRKRELRQKARVVVESRVIKLVGEKFLEWKNEYFVRMLMKKQKLRKWKLAHRKYVLLLEQYHSKSRVNILSCVLEQWAKLVTCLQKGRIHYLRTGYKAFQCFVKMRQIEKSSCYIIRKKVLKRWKEALYRCQKMRAVEEEIFKIRKRQIFATWHQLWRSVLAISKLKMKYDRIRMKKVMESLRIYYNSEQVHDIEFRMNAFNTWKKKRALNSVYSFYLSRKRQGLVSNVSIKIRKHHYYSMWKNYMGRRKRIQRFFQRVALNLAFCRWHVFISRINLLKKFLFLSERYFFRTRCKIFFVVTRNWLKIERESDVRLNTHRLKCIITKKKQVMTCFSRYHRIKKNKRIAKERWDFHKKRTYLKFWQNQYKWTTEYGHATYSHKLVTKYFERMKKYKFFISTWRKFELWHEKRIKKQCLNNMRIASLIQQNTFHENQVQKSHCMRSAFDRFSTTTKSYMLLRLFLQQWRRKISDRSEKKVNKVNEIFTNKTSQKRACIHNGRNHCMENPSDVAETCLSGMQIASREHTENLTEKDQPLLIARSEEATDTGEKVQIVHEMSRIKNKREHDSANDDEIIPPIERILNAYSRDLKTILAKDVYCILRDYSMLDNQITAFDVSEALEDLNIHDNDKTMVKNYMNKQYSKEVVKECLYFLVGKILSSTQKNKAKMDTLLSRPLFATVVSKHVLPLMKKYIEKNGSCRETVDAIPDELLDTKIVSIFQKNRATLELLYAHFGKVFYDQPPKRLELIQLVQKAKYHNTKRFASGRNGKFLVPKSCISLSQVIYLLSCCDIVPRRLRKRQVELSFHKSRSGSASEKTLCFPEFLEFLGRISICAFQCIEAADSVRMLLYNLDPTGRLFPGEQPILNKNIKIKSPNKGESKDLGSSRNKVASFIYSKENPILIQKDEVNVKNSIIRCDSKSTRPSMHAGSCNENAYKGVNINGYTGLPLRKKPNYNIPSKTTKLDEVYGKVLRSPRPRNGPQRDNETSQHVSLLKTKPSSSSKKKPITHSDSFSDFDHNYTFENRIKNIKINDPAFWKKFDRILPRRYFDFRERSLTSMNIDDNDVGIQTPSSDIGDMFPPNKDSFETNVGQLLSSSNIKESNIAGNRIYSQLSKNKDHLSAFQEVLSSADDELCADVENVDEVTITLTTSGLIDIT